MINQECSPKANTWNATSTCWKWKTRNAVPRQIRFQGQPPTEHCPVQNATSGFTMKVPRFWAQNMDSEPRTGVALPCPLTTLICSWQKRYSWTEVEGSGLRGIKVIFAPKHALRPGRQSCCNSVSIHNFSPQAGNYSFLSEIFLFENISTWLDPLSCRLPLWLETSSVCMSMVWWGNLDRVPLPCSKEFRWLI